MSSVLRPVGPERPATYWRRRAVLLAGVIVLILVIAFACTGGSSGNQTPKARPKTTPTPISTPVTTPATHRPNRCTSPDVSVTLSTDKHQYAAGSSLTLIATLSNTTDTTCSLVSGASRQHWTINSGHDKVWTTTGCVSSKAVATIRIKAHAERTLTTRWDGHRLNPGCQAGPTATAGTYVLSGTIDGLPAKSVVFQLT